MTELGNILAVILARGGSKGIPGKNLKLVGGISLVGRAARFASSLQMVTKTVISSDDDTIIKEAVKFGAEAPFQRPAELSSDTALSVDAWRHAWLTSEEHYGIRIETSLLFEPTSPLREADDVTKVLEALQVPNVLSATTVSKIPSHFAPPKVFSRTQSGMLQSMAQDPEKSSIRQSLNSYYNRNGLVYAARRQAIVELRSIVGSHCAGITTERSVVNIDTLQDLSEAEALIRSRGMI